MTFTCGHTAEVPADMGRGEARKVRVAKYFDRPCCDCAVTRATSYRLTLTNTKGALLSEVAKTDVSVASLVASKLAETLAKIKRSY
jgi:hypothetical protein